ncbi:hypothetical protein JOC95_001979 [Bacillus tianshenii]|uniref:Uncharacterized protein n=1 Tax=Sutcliffiella tianshenii TaxID=1463404 RepID=A0ABS2NZJ8_9BACI|nr:hypothetical protein [Bacillus tianshenii]
MLLIPSPACFDRSEGIIHVNLSSFHHNLATFSINLAGSPLNRSRVRINLSKILHNLSADPLANNNKLQHIVNPLIINKAATTKRPLLYGTRNLSLLSYKGQGPIDYASF